MFHLFPTWQETPFFLGKLESDQSKTRKVDDVLLLFVKLPGLPTISTMLSAGKPLQLATKTLDPVGSGEGRTPQSIIESTLQTPNSHRNWCKIAMSLLESEFCPWKFTHLFRCDLKLKRKSTAPKGLNCRGNMMVLQLTVVKISGCHSFNPVCPHSWNP